MTLPRWILVAAGLALAGCGGQAGGDDDVVRVYVSEQLRGPAGGNNEVVLAEQMALQEAGGRAGRFRVELKVLDESSTTPEPPPSVLENTRRAVADERAVALLGNANSESTAAAIPVTRRAGLLHVSPQSTNVGLTARGGTFARVIPNDAVQAQAMLHAMRRERVRRAIAFDDGSLFGRELCALVKKGFRAAGIADAETPAIVDQLASPSGLGRELRRARVDGMAYCGGVPPNVVTTFHAEAPEVEVFLADVAFGTDLAEGDLGKAAERLHITGPAVDAPAAQRFMARFEKRFGTRPDPQVLGGYETMKALLAAIERAGDRGDEREAVREAFFATVREDSVLGPYRITAAGDSTVDRYGVYRIRDRRIVPAGTIRLQPATSR